MDGLKETPMIIDEVSHVTITRLSRVKNVLKSPEKWDIRRASQLFRRLNSVDGWETGQFSSVDSPSRIFYMVSHNFILSRTNNIKFINFLYISRQRTIILQQILVQLEYFNLTYVVHHCINRTTVERLVSCPRFYISD